MTTETSPPVKFTGRQRLIMLVVLGAAFVFAADYSILNVALPKVGAGVGLHLTGLPWIVSAYTLPAAGFMLFFGRISDLFGRRRMFLAGIILLTGASLLGGFSKNPEMLLTARALQGTSTAITVPAGLSIITTTFSDGPLRDRALGLNGAILSGGFTAGALVGGALVSLLTWRAAFFVNVPVAAVILATAPRLISEGRTPEKVKLDLPGAVTVTGGLLAVVYAIMEKNVISGVIGAVLLVAFYVIESRSAAPLAPVRFLKKPTVAFGNYAGLVIFSMETGMIFLMTLYLQDVLHFAPVIAGLIFGIPGIAAVFAGPLAGRFLGKFGPRRVLAVGMTIQALMVFPLVFMGTSRIALLILMPALFIGFFAHVSCIVGYSVIGTSGLANEDQGLATALTSMTQQVALTIGAPVMVSIAASQSAQLTGYRVALGVNVAVVLASMAVIWFGLRERGTAPAAVPVQGSAEELAASMD